MRKIFLIIVIMISSFSYYGVIDENDENTVNVQETEITENIIQEENVITEESEVIDIEMTENGTSEKQSQDSISTNQVVGNKNTTTTNTTKQTNTTTTITNTNTTAEKAKVNTNTKTNTSTSTNTTTTTEKATENETVKVERCTNCNNHAIEVGNCRQWFDTKNQAISIYKAEIKKWEDMWISDEIDDDTYYSNCPCGYEIWSCMYCGKWTINFYFR